LRSTKQRLQKKVHHLKTELGNRDSEIAVMQSSKLWKLMQKWVGLKKVLPGLTAKSSPVPLENSALNQGVKSAAEPIQTTTPANGVLIEPQPTRQLDQITNQKTTDQISAIGSSPELLFPECPAFKLHLGCGNHLLSGWLNIDTQIEQNSVQPTLQHDLTQPLPFSSESIEFIVSEHFIEHVTRDQACHLLRECYRFLKPEGVLRISTPDLEKLVSEYLAKRTDEWQDMGWVAATPCQMVNEGMRLWGHQFLYDASELSMLLREAGFCQVIPVKWRASHYAELQNLELRPFHQEVILEAVK